MLGLRESLSRPQHADGNPWDDGPLPDLTSGLMWTATGLLGAAVLWLPGSERGHAVLALGLAAFAVAWGLFSLVLAARGHGMTVGFRALVTATTMPVVALSLWATGGATSFLQPVMIFTALFISYFFPPRLAWPLMALFVYAYATPLFYDDQAIEVGYPARLAMFALAVARPCRSSSSSAGWSAPSRCSEPWPSSTRSPAWGTGAASTWRSSVPRRATSRTR
jgi:hypothetical protein